MHPLLNMALSPSLLSTVEGLSTFSAPLSIIIQSHSKPNKKGANKPGRENEASLGCHLWSAISRIDVEWNTVGLIFLNVTGRKVQCNACCFPCWLRLEPCTPGTFSSNPSICLFILLFIRIFNGNSSSTGGALGISQFAPTSNEIIQIICLNVKWNGREQRVTSVQQCQDDNWEMRNRLRMNRICHRLSNRQSGGAIC